MTWLEIRPRDVWLFRDGKPFNAGEDNSAHSMFPPTPLTVQGALRQKISEGLGVSFWDYKKASKKEDKALDIDKNPDKAVSYIGRFQKELETGAFRMIGPFVSMCDGDKIVPLFPTPADLLIRDEDHDFIITTPNKKLTSNMPNDDLLLPNVIPDYENLSGYWMTADAFENYLEGQKLDATIFTPKQDLCSEDEDQNQAEGKVYPSPAHKAYAAGQRIWHNNLVYKSENRFGVSTNSATSFREEGQLYQAQFIRPQQNIGLLVQVTGIPEDKLLAGDMLMGGEQKQAFVSICNEPFTFLGKRNIDNELFKIIFLTPAYLKCGWKPSCDKNEDKDNIHESWSRLFSADVELVSAALYRPQRIGGWNGAANRPRTMHNYIAPGSVYYFRAKEAFTAPPALTENPHEIKEAAAIGFGQYAITTWKSN